MPTLRRRRQLGRPTKTSPHVHTCTASTRGGRRRGRRPPAAAGQGQACPNAGHAPRRPAGRPRPAAAPPWAARWRPTAGGGAGVRRPAATSAVAHDLRRRSGAVVTRPWQRLSPSWEGRLDAAVTAMARPAAGRGGSGPADPSRERAAAGAGPPRRPPHRGRRRLRRPLGSGGCVSYGSRCTWRHKNGARAPPTRGSRHRRGCHRCRHRRGHGRRPLRHAGARRARGRPGPIAASAAAAAETPPAVVAAALTHRAQVLGERTRSPRPPRI